MADQSSGPKSRPWEPLKQAFLARLQTSTSSSQATELWRLFAGDLWFQQQLETRARKTLLARVGRLDWLGDVIHETLLLLARRLAKTPDLRVDLEIVDETFPGWIGAILDRECGEAIRWLRRLHRMQLAALEKVADPRAKQVSDARVDVSLAIDAQQEPYRTLLWLSAKGFSVQEIAERLGMSYWEAYRRLHAGFAHLERRLASYQHERGRMKRAFPVSSSSTMTN